MPPESKRNRTNNILVILLIGAAFTIGMFWQKIQNLEKNGGTPTTAGTGTTTDTAGAPPAGPSPEEMAKNVKPVGDDDFVRGSNDAPVTWIEFSDLECPFCKKIHPDLVKLMDEYDGKVRWVYRHFPLDSLHPNARIQAEGSECAANIAGDEGFWKYVDALQEHTGDAITKEKLPDFAANLGINKATFTECLNSAKFAQNVEDDYQNGIQSGVSGTPGNIVMNKDGEIKVLPGAYPYDQMKAAVDSLL